MKIAVIGDRTADNSIDICCSFLAFKEFEYSILAQHAGLESSIADLTIISHHQLVACAPISGTLFVISAEPDSKYIPSTARFVFRGASEQEIIFRLNQCIQSSIQYLDTEATLLNSIFEPSNSIQLLADRDGTVERYRAGNSGVEQSDLVTTRG